MVIAFIEPFSFDCQQMDGALNGYLYKLVANKRNSTIVGKVICVPKSGSQILSETPVMIQLKDGACKSFKIGDLRDATKRERKEFEE